MSKLYTEDQFLRIFGGVIATALKELAKLEPVQIVRCKDCKHWDRDTLVHQSNDFREWDEAECMVLAERDGYHEINRNTEESDFCSCGERKADGGR